MRLAYFTICARNYLAYALTLRESLLAASPGAAFYIFLADAPVEGGAPCEGVIPASELALPDYADMAFRYTVMEFSTAIKPFAFEHLFERLGYEAGVYLDPDILVLRPLAPVTAALGAGAEAVLTPHITAPLEDGESPDDLAILKSGTYNLGFAAFRNTPAARKFLAWWGRRLAKDGFADPEAGLFVDQKFAEFAPSFIEKTAILRDAGLNVAYWNLAHRPLARDGTGWTASGAPLCFFHFSGVVPGDPSVFSKHQTRFLPKDIGAAKDLLTDYLARLVENGHRKWASVPYAYDHYTDGTLIPAEARRLYARGLLKKGASRDGLFASDVAVLNAPAGDVDQDVAPITVFMAEIWRGRADLRRLFPLSSAAGRRAFHRWFLAHGGGEHRAGEALLAPAREGAGGPLRVEEGARALYRRLPRKLQEIFRRKNLSPPAKPRP